MELGQLNRMIRSIAERFGAGGDLVAVLRGAGLVMIIQIGAAGLNYVSQVLLARWMGPVEFGVYVFAWSWVLPLATAAAIGLAAAAVRFVPQYLTKDAWGHLLGLIHRSTSLVLGAGIFVGAIGLVILYLLDNWLDDYYIAPTRIALLCVPFITLIVLLSGVARGFGWVGLAFVPQMLLVPAALIAGTLLHGLFIGTPSAVAILAWVLAGCGLIAAGHSYLFRRSMPNTVLSATPVYDTRTWLRVAIPLFLADGVFLILWNADTVMLGSMMQPEDVSIYHASVKTAALTCLVFNAVRSFAAPKFSALWADKDLLQNEHFTRSIAAWTFWPTAAVVLGVIILGKFILSIFGPEFVAGYPVLVVLCSGYLARTFAGPLSAYLAVSGYHDDVLFVNAGTAISNVALNAGLIPLFGIMGAAVATVLSIVISQVAFYILVRRRLGINAFFLARS